MEMAAGLSNPRMTRYCRALLVLSISLQSVVVGAQSAAPVLSLDYFLTSTVTGESQHEILPVAIFDGTSFKHVREWDPVLGWSTRRPYLLTRCPAVQILRHGEAVGSVTVSDISLRGFRCSGLMVGTVENVSTAPAPVSEISRIARRRENSEQIGYATDIDRSVPRPELLPLGIDDTHAYRFTRLDGVVVSLPGSGTRVDAFGKGPNDRFIDAFLHANGNVYLVFERQNYEVWHLRLYRLGPAFATELILETELYGC